MKQNCNNVVHFVNQNNLVNGHNSIRFKKTRNKHICNLSEDKKFV